MFYNPKYNQPELKTPPSIKILKELYKVLEQHNVKFSIQIKRIDTGNGKDWVPRYCWELVHHNNYYYAECEWEGFATLSGCIKNLVKTVEVIEC